MLDDLGLVPALLWHFERYTGQTGVEVLFEHKGPQRRFTPEIETAVYRIVQEGLTNVARHARVDQVMVRLTAGKAGLNVDIQDRGAGFDTEQALSNGTSNGLNGMRERAALLGGDLDLAASPGKGTTVYFRVPLDAKNGS